VIECVGPISCEAGICGRKCSGSGCPEGIDDVSCIVSPCSVLDSACDEDYAACTDYYCGGCNVFAFDESGARVCNSVTSSGVCYSSLDCPDDYYCSAGECRANSECATTLDCRNPNNKYFVAACVGLLQCNDNGACGIDCGVSPCPNNGQPVTCFVAPCDVKDACAENYEHCINNNCNGCSAIFLDAAGNEVCNDDED
jgi:hypothetical protein